MPSKPSADTNPDPAPELVPAWGDWTVTCTAPAGTGTGIVRLCWRGKPVSESKGPIAYDNACAMAAHFHARNHIPKLTDGKCLADLTPAGRQAACLAGVAGHGVKPSAGKR
jgi:hypothetical protein